MKQRTNNTNFFSDIILTTFILSVAFFILATTASGIELLSYKDSNTGLHTYDASTITKIWESDVPACIKDGAKLVGVNSAFKKRNLGYRDCSSSKQRKKIHNALGIQVVYIKLSELPVDMIREIKGVK